MPKCHSSLCCVQPALTLQMVPHKRDGLELAEEESSQSFLAHCLPQFSKTYCFTSFTFFVINLFLSPSSF